MFLTRIDRLPLSSFVVRPDSKTPFNLALSGITNDDVDLSVDALKAVTLPLLKRFGVAEDGGLELKVLCCYFLLFVGDSICVHLRTPCEPCKVLKYSSVA